MPGAFYVFLEFYFVTVNFDLIGFVGSVVPVAVRAVCGCCSCDCVLMLPLIESPASWGDRWIDFGSTNFAIVNSI